MRTIICTTGTSIANRVLREGDQSRGEELFRKAVRDRLKKTRQETDNDEEFLIKASAETNSLARLNVSNADEIFLLHTDTDEGYWCASEVASLLKGSRSIECRLERIKGLQVGDERQFRCEGLQNLFDKLDSICSQSAGREILLNVTGGFKSVVPYVTLFGLFKRLPVVYIFERSNTLLHLPPAPLNLDYERLARAREAIVKLGNGEPMSREEFFRCIPGLPYNERDWYESLLEDVGNDKVTLSAIGYLVHGYAKEQHAQIRLSPAALDAYTSADPSIRRTLTHLLDRLGDPLWRRAHEHSFPRTELKVCKPGSTPHRVAYLVRDEVVYVCELYLKHDEYERELPGRKIADYDLRCFDPWQRPPDEPEPPESEAEEFDQAYERLERRCYELTDDLQKAQKDREEAEERLLACDEEREKAEARASQLAQEVSELHAKVVTLEKSLGEQASEAAGLREELRNAQGQIEQLEADLATARLPWWKKLFTPACVTKSAGRT